LLGILHEGFWLGCLDARDLTSITIRDYQQSRMYNAPGHNQSGLFPWEVEAIERFFRRGSRILVAGCGGGREIVAVHRLGFQADGFDCTPSLVATSRRLLQDLCIASNVVHCPPNDVPQTLATYDGLIVGWTAYTQIPGSARRVAFLRKLHAVVPPGAPMLISFWVREDGVPDEERTFRLAKWVRSLLGRGVDPLEFGDRVIERGYHHCFIKEEIEAELKAGGFRLSHYSEDDYPHAVGTSDTSMTRAAGPT
jgi:hypothetical protein